MNFKEGEVLCFDKPLTWTSFAVVNKIRYHLCRKLGVKKLKVGHAGTLDPLATGVMIICTGKATKRIEEFQYHTKEYVATLMLGATTPSYDLEKEIDAILPDLKELTFDMTDLEYVSSAGLRVILKAQKIMNTKGSMKLIGVNDSIMEVFDITGFIDILTIE